MLTKAERDAIRTAWKSHGEGLGVLPVPALLDDLDAKDKEIANLKVDVDCALEAGKSWELKQPFCEHENRFATTDDGGKTGYCVMCRNERLTADRTALARAIDPMSETPAAERPTEELVAMADDLREQLKAYRLALERALDAAKNYRAARIGYPGENYRPKWRDSDRSITEAERALAGEGE